MSFEDGGSDDEDGRSRTGSKQTTEAKYVDVPQNFSCT